MSRSWQLAKSDDAPLGSQFQNEIQNLPESIRTWLSNRGYQENQSILQLQKSSLQGLASPFNLKDMDRAANRIAEAFFKAESICIYGDFDMDGTPAVALLIKGLQDLGYERLNYYQPSRLLEGYGLHVHAIKKLKERGCDLLITVDVGTTAVESAKFAKSLGLDLIITDHHLPGETLPEAFALVNPNQGNCQSEMGYLAGTGVAFYLLLAVASVLKKSGVVAPEFNIKKYLDLFALGTIADMVPLRDDNHALVKHGLHQMQHTENPGLCELLKSLDLWGRSLKSSDISMKLAPCLNALSRLEIETKPIEILLCKDKILASQLAEEAKKVNLMRKKLQNQAYEFAKEALLDWPHSEFIYLSSNSFHKGVMGLVATKLVQEFGVPTFIGYQDQNRVIGSARVPDSHENIDLTQVLQFTAENLDKFGGHKMAAGFELNKAQEPVFVLRLAEYFAALPQLKNKNRITPLTYDADLNIEEIDSNFMTFLDRFEPFGQGFAAPTFRLSQVEIMGVRHLSGGHLKLTCKGRSGCKDIEALWFSPAETKWLKSVRPGLKLDMLVQLQWNHYNGIKTVQLIVEDLKLATN